VVHEREQRGTAGLEVAADAAHVGVGDAAVEERHTGAARDTDKRRGDGHAQHESCEQADRAAADGTLARRECVLLTELDAASAAVVARAAGDDGGVPECERTLVREVGQGGESLFGRRCVVEDDGDEACARHPRRVARATRRLFAPNG